MIVFIIIVFIWSCIPRSMMQSRTFQEIMIYSQWCGLTSSMCSTFWGYLDNVTGNKAVAWWGNWLPCWWKEQEVPLQGASKWDERILWPFCNVLAGTAGAELSCLKTGLGQEKVHSGSSLQGHLKGDSMTATDTQHSDCAGCFPPHYKWMPAVLLCNPAMCSWEHSPQFGYATLCKLALLSPRQKNCPVSPLYSFFKFFFKNHFVCVCVYVDVKVYVHL